jgi:hypothetical protein
MHASASLFRGAGGAHVGAIAWSAVVYGGVAIAATDFLYCLLYWVPQGVSPMRLWQGIAAGALGRAAFHGGIGSALLGAGFQWLIGAAFVLAYALAALCWPRLQRSINAHGVGYGLLLYAVMNGIVVPLSAAPHPLHPQLAWILTNVPMFAVFGVIAAHFAVHALQPGTRNAQ